MYKKTIIMTVFGCLLSSVLLAQEVRVEALFKGTAVLRIDGQQVMLKEGESHDSGVRLIRATAKKATIEIDGKQQDVGLNMAIGGTYIEPKMAQVVVRKNNYNQYMVNGSINGFTVKFLVDTGANMVAMNEQDAKRLGIQYKLNGVESRVSTASGIAKSWSVQLGAVKVGEIGVRNVRGAVIQGNYPDSVLLGMSFLENVKMQEKNSILLLEKKF